jgi:hypothetical protein
MLFQSNIFISGRSIFRIALTVLSFLFSVLNQNCFAQSVGIGTNRPDTSAILELSSGNRGFLPPRLSTTQRDSIVTPAAGLMIYNATIGALQYFNGSVWVTSDSSGSQPNPATSYNETISVIYGMDNNLVRGGYAFAKKPESNWIQQVLPYINQGYKDTFNRNQVVVYGMDNGSSPGGFAFGMGTANQWFQQTLPYVNQLYKATASGNQIVLFGMDTQNNPGGYAFAFTADGTWVQQRFPFLNQGYRAIASGNQIVLYGYDTQNNPGGLAFAFTPAGEWIQQTLPFLNQGYKATGTSNK